MNAGLDALDRGVIEAGLTSAQALDRIAALETRIAALSRVMQLVAEEAGYGNCTGPLSGEYASGYQSAVAVQARRRQMHLVKTEASQ